jgi:hypothetical protein
VCSDQPAQGSKVIITIEGKWSRSDSAQVVIEIPSRSSVSCGTKPNRHTDKPPYEMTYLGRYLVHADTLCSIQDMR